MFQAIRHGDRENLRVLADTFFGAGNNVSALLCFDHAFSSTPDLHGLPLSEIKKTLLLFLSYIRLLDKFLFNDSLTEGSNRQNLFGFRVLGENRYLVPKRNILYEKLTKRSPDMDGYRCGSEELRRCINNVIKARIRDRTNGLDKACRDIGGFLPCLRLLVQKECNPSRRQGTPCHFQHIQWRELTVEWYRNWFSLLFLQFRILDVANCHDLHVIQ